VRRHTCAPDRRKSAIWRWFRRCTVTRTPRVCLRRRRCGFPQQTFSNASSPRIADIHRRIVPSSDTVTDWNSVATRAACLARDSPEVSNHRSRPWSFSSCEISAIAGGSAALHPISEPAGCRGAPGREAVAPPSRSLCRRGRDASSRSSRSASTAARSGTTSGAARISTVDPRATFLHSKTTPSLVLAVVP